MSYIIAKQVAAKLNNNYDLAVKTLKGIKGINSGEMGLTPDAIKFGAEYRATKIAMDKEFAALRAFNRKFAKQYKKEIQADRLARRYAE
jgi:hypothetical protein